MEAKNIIDLEDPAKKKIKKDQKENLSSDSLMTSNKKDERGRDGGFSMSFQEVNTCDGNMDLVTLLKEAGQEAKLLMMNFSNSVSDSEKFEDFSLSRLDKIIKSALAVEENLKQQKNILRQKLQHITKALQNS